MACMEQIYRKKRWAADLLCCLFIWLYVFQLLTNNDEVGVQSTIYVRSRRKSAMLSERSFVLLCVLWYRRRQSRGGSDRQTADCSWSGCLQNHFPDGKSGRSFSRPSVIFSYVCKIHHITCIRYKTITNHNKKRRKNNGKTLFSLWRNGQL